MGIGHVAVGFALKRTTPQLSLGLLVAATIFVDLLWSLFVGLGLEHVRIVPGLMPASAFDLYDFPITHSLVGSLGWALLAGGAWLAFRGDRRAALVLGAAVLSHWFLDVIAHRPDMPVLPHGPYLGLGMWNSLPLSLLVEAVMLLAGVALYVQGTRARDRVGRIGLAALVVFFFVMLVAGYLAPPPPVSAIPWTAPTLLVPIVAAHYVDAHRLAR